MTVAAGARKIVPSRSELDRLPTCLTDGEWEVLEYFDTHLPEGWEIFYTPHLNGLRPDFVLLHPNVGIAVFEVKDWPLTETNCMRTADGLIRVNSQGVERIERDDPAQKALQYRDEIRNLYCPSLRRSGLRAVAAGIILPRTSQEVAERLFACTPPSWSPGPFTVTGSDVIATAGIEHTVPDAAWPSSKYMTEQVADDLRHWLEDPEFAREQREPPVLTGQQSEIVRNAQQVPRRRVRGAAGSGKTLALAGRAALLSGAPTDAQHPNVLVVSYNITLVGYLRDITNVFVRSYGGHPDAITFLHWHGWARRVMYQLSEGDEWARSFKDDRPSSADGDLGVVVAQTIAKAGENPPIDCYDAILVDEGQDLEPSWWNALRLALKDRDRGEMLLVVDRAQDLYRRNPRWTDEAMTGLGFSGGRWMQLRDSYRMPTWLIELARLFASEYLLVPDEELPTTPDQGEFELEPVHLRWIQVDESRLAAAGASAILSLVHTSDDKPGTPVVWADVVLVSDSLVTGRAIRSALPSSIKVMSTYAEDEPDQRRAKLYFFKGDARVKATTVHSIKGWETTAIVVAVGPHTRESGAQLLYTAMTRLKRRAEGCHLTIICADNRFAEFGRYFEEFTDLRD